MTTRNKTGVIIATGPSLTQDQIDLANKSKSDEVLLFGCNLTYRVADLDCWLACNPSFFDYYWPRDEKLRNGEFDKWTWDKPTAIKYGINHVKGGWADGLSTDPEYIHYHHGAGPQIMNLALHYGVKTMLLIGWDMCYRKEKHYFGDYPDELKHNPKTGPNGELEGLIKEMETIKPEDYNIDIVNCTPGSAMKCFPFGRLEDYL